MPVRENFYRVITSPVNGLEVDQSYLIYYRDDTDVFAVSFDEAGTAVEEVGFRIESSSIGRAIYPPASDGLGEGCRIALNGNDIITMDFLAGATYTYTPPVGWTAAAPQQIAPEGPIYWIEYEAGLETDTIQARLRTSVSAKWTNVTTVRTMTVDGSPLIAGEWGQVAAKGPEYTESVASLWISRVDEQDFWYRIVLLLNGSSDDQRAGQDSDPILERRSGFPLTSSSGLISSATSEVNSSLIRIWDGDVDDHPSTDYPTWPSANPMLIGDLSPDPGGVGVWILRTVTGRGIYHVSDAESILTSISTNWSFSPIPGTSITHDGGSGGIWVKPY